MTVVNLNYNIQTKSCQIGSYNGVLNNFVLCMLKTSLNYSLNPNTLG